MTTLLEFATNDVNRATQDKADAQTALATAQTGLAGAQKERDDTAVLIADLKNQITAKRLELGNAAMPADAQAATNDLAQLLIALRAKQAHAVDVQVQIDTFQGQLDVELESLGAATAKLVQATTAHVTAEKTDADHTAWGTAMGVPPVQGIGGTAHDLTTGALYASAQARAVDGFHADLLDHVQKRRGQELARTALVGSTLDGLRDDLDSKKQADQGLAGTVVQLQTAYDRAGAAFRDAVTGAQDRFNRAQGLLAMIAGAPALSAAERSRMLDGNIVGAAKDDPRHHQEALDTAQLAQAQARAARKQRRHDLGLPELPDLANADQEVTDANNTAAAAAPAFTQDDRNKLAAWSQTVPDSSWLLLAAFLEADQALRDLQAMDLGALQNAMTNAGTALGGALEALAGSDHTVMTLGDQVKQQSKLLDAANGNKSARILNALRGDG